MIESIQKRIQDIYRLPIFPKVHQYLLSPAQFHSFSNGLDRPQVIYLDEEADASIGVYLGKKVFKSITRNKHVFSIQDFCVVAEEVSHFVYLLWSKCNSKKINLLDLEIQAEIDKFLLADEIFQNDKMMIDKLFTHFSMRKGLSKEEVERYLTANRLGKKLAMEWKKKKISHPQKVNWLRFFYRQNPHSRISMIERGLQ